MLSKSRFNPGPGIADFWQEFRKPQPYRLPIIAASMLPIALIFYWALDEQVYVPPAAPEVTYITSFAPDRTDEEIVASNIENQKRKDALAARQAEIEERKKGMYRELGRASGFDVDAMEEQIAAERAAEDARSETARPAQEQQLAD